MSDYLVCSLSERSDMLKFVGAPNLEALFEALPCDHGMDEALKLPLGQTETELLRSMRQYAMLNRRFETIFRGAGAYRHLIPTAVDALANRSEFVTAYTPYQAEMSQGGLQAIFEFQTEICELTGMDAANASVYDGATAAGEALLMAQEKQQKKILVSASCPPRLIAVARTYAEAAGLSCDLVPLLDGRLDCAALRPLLNAEICALLLPQINYFGLIEDVESIRHELSPFKVKLILTVNPVAAALLPSAAEWGADIAVGEGQPLGIPLSFGGPYLGFMACRSSLLRRLPGRIAGQGVDANGKPAYVLTLQAREQHIRREKATSSLCTNQALLALRASIYMALLGPEGLKEVGQRCVDNAHYLAAGLCATGNFRLAYSGEFFHEFVLESTLPSVEIERCLADKGILSGLPLDGRHMLWCATEANTKSEMDEAIALCTSRNAAEGIGIC